jgi:hypothetical protein
MTGQSRDLGMTILFLAQANDRLATAKNEREAHLARLVVRMLEKSLHGYTGTLRETTAFMALFFGGEYDEAIDDDG